MPTAGSSTEPDDPAEPLEPVEPEPVEPVNLESVPLSRPKVSVLIPDRIVSVGLSRTLGLRGSVTRSVADVGHLVRFRAGTIRRRSLVVSAVSFVVLTAAVAVVPAYLPDAGSGDGRAFDALLLLPTALAGFVILAIVSASASGGGRELLARDPAGVHPISPFTDHLGALLLAPLNIAWLLQAWSLLGVTAYALGPGALLVAQPVVVLWLLAGTAVAQVVAWLLEGLRRTRHGIGGVRALTVVVIGTTLGLQLSEQLLGLFDRIPTRMLVVAMVGGVSWRWAATLGVVALIFVAAVLLGALPATMAAHRTPRDELRRESGHYTSRPRSRTVLGALVRVDRGSVWRAVPMRRGVLVLALGPGIVALLGGLPWTSMTILPGLVASGGALLYGVNAWCLDGRGALWRENLPVSPTTVFDARALVLAEFLFAASMITVAVASVRAGVPAVPELVALVCTVLVVTVQVTAASMRWSAARPYAVDLRSARATPAPPVVMLGYSTRLAVSTTFVGLIFSGLTRVDSVYSLLVAVPFLCWSSARLLRTRRAWGDPPERARIVTTVALA